MRHARRWAAVLAVAVLSGCASGTGVAEDDATAAEGRVRVLAEISGYNRDDPHIRVTPLGTSVSVAVTTYGGGCHSRGDTKVRVAGLVADVTPYDYTAQPGTPCTRILRSFEHVVTVAFDRPGRAHIRVHGIDTSTRHAGNLRGDSIVVERTVDVR